MKKSITLLLLATMFFVTRADIIEKTYRFENHQIKQLGNYQALVFDNTLLNGFTGEPSLPYCAVQLLLPPGHNATDIEFIGKDIIKLEGYYNIYPRQASRQLS